MCGPNGSFQYNCPTTDSDDQIARRNSRRPSNEYTAVAGRCYLSWRSATSWHEVLGRTLEPLDRFHIELWLSQVELHRWRSASKTNKSKQIQGAGLAVLQFQPWRWCSDGDKQVKGETHQARCAETSLGPDDLLIYLWSCSSCWSTIQEAANEAHQVELCVR